MKVKDVMSEHPITVGPETSLKEVAKTFAEHRISGAPVVGPEGTVLGVISEADVVVKEMGPDASRHGLLARLLFADADADPRGAAKTAGDAMTSPAITTMPNRSIAEVACTMVDRGVKRLPVVDEHGTLVGIVSRGDLVRAFARSDADVEREIREDVVAGMFWVDDPGLEIRVDQGNVRLAGRIARRTDCELLPGVVARVPGVVSVTSTLRWRYDDRGMPLDELERGVRTVRQR